MTSEGRPFRPDKRREAPRLWQLCYLEMSNTDLSTEMANMITTQRGFQANTKIITVTDQMLEELVNMKR